MSSSTLISVLASTASRFWTACPAITASHTAMRPISTNRGTSTCGTTRAGYLRWTASAT